MGCQAEVFIGDNLTFSLVSHDPDTGVLTDTDSPPAYRLYEDETGTPILTGAMAKLDDAGTTGFYTELIACTSGNGFESGKSYTVYIEATVGGDTGGIAYGFRALTEPPSAAAIAAAVVGATIEGALTMEETLRILLAFSAGKTAGGATTSIAFRDQADTKDRIVMTVDADGDRSAIVVDGS